jgi:hypothetical protein
MSALYFDSRTYQAAVALGAASPIIPGSEPGSANIHLATVDTDCGIITSLGGIPLTLPLLYLVGCCEAPLLAPPVATSHDRNLRFVSAVPDYKRGFLERHQSHTRPGYRHYGAGITK